jgi:hypothetical protein
VCLHPANKLICAKEFEQSILKCVVPEQVKYCVLLMPSGALKITGGDIPENVKSEKQVEDEEVSKIS